MTAESPVAALRREYDAIARQLDSAPGNAEREAAKREIIAYFKKVDGMLSELTQLKDDIRQLVDRYKQIAADTKQAAAPEFTGQRPVLHADHIGATTFIEKGWSLISLGDHAGAIQALTKALQLSPGETQAESLLGWAQMLHEDYDDALGTFQKVLMKEPANSLARINVGYICLKKRIFGEAIEHLSQAARSRRETSAVCPAAAGPHRGRCGSCDGRRVAASAGVSRLDRRSGRAIARLPGNRPTSRSSHPHHPRSDSGEVRLAHPRPPSFMERGRGVSRCRYDCLVDRPAVRPSDRRAAARARPPRAALARPASPAALVRGGLRRCGGAGMGPV